MAENEIRVVISGVASDLRRALEGAKGDLSGLAVKIKEVPNEIKIDVQAQTAAATVRLRELRDMAKDVPKRISIQADADTGIAEAKLRLLERQARQTEEAIARAQLGSLISGGGGGGGPGVLGGLGGLPGFAGSAGLGVAAAPFAVAGAGSLTAIAGSAGAGLLGLGALLTSSLGTLGVGLGSMLGVALQAKTGITNVTTAMDALEKAQGDYGASSKQAQQAQQNLNVVIAEAGPQAAKIATALGDLGDQWTKVSQPAQRALYGIMIPALKVAEKLMPTVAGIATQAFQAIGTALDPVFKGLSSPAFQKVLTTLGNDFAKLAGPGIGAFSNLMRAFFNVAIAAAPYLIEIAKAFERWTKSFADSLAPGARMHALIGDLVGQLRSWWNLAVALGHLMATIFKTGADTGQQLVTQLTAILIRWNAWLNTSAGQASLHTFFSQSADLLRAVATTLGAIAPLLASMAVGLIPTMTTLLTPLAKILASMSQWINGISKDLPPVLSALPGLAVAVGVIASWQALRALVASTFAMMTGRGAAAAVAPAAGVVAGGEKGSLGIGTKILGGLGLATFGTLLSTEIGNAIAGGAGRAIKDIGTGASIGGGIGSLFGPWGAAAGAALGGGIAAAIRLFDGRSAGQKIGDEMSKGFGDSTFKTTVAKLIDDANGLIHKRTVGAAPSLGDQAKGVSPHITGPSETDLAAAKQKMILAGQEVAAQLEKGWAQYRFQSEPVMFEQFTAETRKLPVAAQQAALASMVSFAQQLERSGRLPVGATRQLLSDVMHQFPALTNYMGLSAGASVEAFTKALDFSRVQANVHAAMGSIADDFSGVQLAMASTQGDTMTKAGAMVKALQGIATYGTGPMKERALADLATLKHSIVSTFDQSGALVAAKMHDISGAVQSGSSSAAKSAGTYWGQFLGAIQHAETGGALTVREGNKIIADELAKALAALGVPAGDAKKLAAQGWSVQAIASGISSAAGAGFGSGPGQTVFAGGGLVQVGRPGERGSDRISMNVGGVPIRVGAGEQVAVFNHQQQALAGRFIPGGLDGLFAATRGARHDMAQGGFVGNVPAMIAEANRVSAAHYPYAWGGGHGAFRGPFDCSGAVSDILHAGGLLSAPRVSGDFMNYGLPGPGPVTIYANPGHVYMSIDGRFFGTSGANPGGGAGWFAGAPRPGFAVRHVGGGGTGAFGQIATPKVKGSGAIVALVRGALGQVTAGANHRLAGAFGAMTGGAFGGGQHSENLANQTVGQQMMLAAGWGMDQWPALQALWSQESGWDANAVNSGSGAYGIPQALGHGHPFALGDVRGQVAWGLQYIRGRYGSPMAAEAHERAFNWYAQGGLIPGFAPGGIMAGRASKRPAAAPKHPAPKRPPAASKHHHSTSKSKYQPFIPKDALKGLLSPDQLRPDRMAAGYARQVTVADQTFQNLLAAQALTPVDDPELVTLSDADVAALDPTGTLGYQTGDQIVNRDGMTVGRFFGPGGAIQGGSFHAGATTRLTQIAAILANRNPRYGALRSEMGAQGAAIAVDSQAIGNRVGRRARIERYLHKSVQRAGVIKAELDVLKSKNLAQALKQALSKQAIAGRLSGLRSHLRTVTDELTAERHSQSLLIPIQQDPTHSNQLQAQAQNLRDSIAIESQLGSTGAGAVQRARSAIYAHDLQSQLAALQKTNVALGGRTLVAGTGGTIGQLTGQIATITADSDSRRNTLADFQQTELIPAAAEIASYVKERADIGKLASIQVRDPNATAAAAAPAAPGPDLAALNALLATQLAQTQQALAVSQSQFGVLQGFAPLLAGRLVGSFQSGIDFVPRTGLALVHRGETIVPDPAGPQGNRAAATVHTAQGPVSIELRFENNEAPLVKLVDARINQRALRVVSDQSGQRARLLAGVRRP